MKVPDANDAVWRSLFSGNMHKDLKFLAAKVLLGRLVPLVQREPAQLQGSIAEVRALLLQNAHLPSVQHDLQQIAG